MLRLEQALGGLAYRAEAPALRPQTTIPWSTLGMAAASLLVAGAAVVFSLAGEPRPVAQGTPTPTPTTSPTTSTTPTPAAWAVTVLSGAPVCGPQRLTSRGALGVGQWLETDADSSARLEVPKIGHVEVSPSTRLRLVTSAPRQRRLELLVGRMTAQVDAGRLRPAAGRRDQGRPAGPRSGDARRLAARPGLGGLILARSPR